MTARAVHWHEGMFLQPHHFQAAQRHTADVSRRRGKWTHHYNWGLRSIDIDLDALSNSRLVIRSLEACLRDGTPVAVPEDGLLPAIDLKGAFDQNRPLTVFLAVPALNLGKANSADGSDDTARFLLDTQELEDENTGVNPQPVRVRLLNLRLLLSGQDQTGFEVLPLVRVEKSALAGAPPQVDPFYIPPILSGDAWKILQADLLQSLCDRIGRKRERLASVLSARRVGRESYDPGDALMVGQLRELNEAYAVLGQLAYADGIHPLTSYLELCRLVGQLVIFDVSGRFPALPKYDHDDLGGCFYAVKRYLDALLDIFLEPEYKERPFIGVGLRTQAEIDAAWLDPAWELYIGVRSQLDPDECRRLLTVPGQLDMKLGSGDRADAIFQLGQAGLKFDPCPRPALLPDVPGEIFFRVARTPESREWQYVQRSLTLAVRVNETRIVGSVQGQRAITIRHGNQTAALQFTLYAVPAE